MPSDGPVLDARKGAWTTSMMPPILPTFRNACVRKLSQNRYAFSFEYKQDGWTVRSEYIHSTGKAFAKSITNFNDANAKDCNLNAKIGNKAQGVYGLVIAPLAQLPKNSRIDVKARYDMYQPNGKSNMQRTQYEAGLNFHIGKRISILTEYALINDKTLAKHNYSMADAEVCFRFSTDTTKARSCYRNEPLLCLLSTTYLRMNKRILLT